MSENPMDIESQAEHFRARGFEVTIENGELRITIGKRKTDRQTENTTDKVSQLLGPDGQPVGTKPKLILPNN